MMAVSKSAHQKLGMHANVHSCWVSALDQRHRALRNGFCEAVGFSPLMSPRYLLAKPVGCCRGALGL